MDPLVDLLWSLLAGFDMPPPILDDGM